MQKVLTTSPKQTKKLAAELGRTLCNDQKRSACVIGLKGDLGAGKTTFIQGFLHALGVRSRIISPTFLILKPYAVQKKGYTRVYHVDVYRLHFPKELEALGFKQILANPQNIVLVEWGDKVRKLLPRSAHWIAFRHGKKENERTIVLK